MGHFSDAWEHCLSWRQPSLLLPVIVVAAAVDFAGLGFLNGVWGTTLQQIIPAGVLGRVNSSDLLISFAVMPIGVRATMIGAAVLTALPCAAVVMLPGGRNVTSLGTPEFGDRVKS